VTDSGNRKGNILPSRLRPETKSEYIDVSMGTCACNTKDPLFDDLASTLKQDLSPLLAA